MGKRLLEQLAEHISATRSMLPASDAKLEMGMLSFTVDQKRFVLVPEQLGKDSMKSAITPLACFKRRMPILLSLVDFSHQA